MKTTEALKITAAISSRARELQKCATDNAARFPHRGARKLRSRYLENAKGHEQQAEAVEILRADHQMLRDELTKVRGMLAGVLQDCALGNIRLSRTDLPRVKQQLKVSAHILKVTQP